MRENTFLKVLSTVTGRKSLIEVSFIFK